MANLMREKVHSWSLYLLPLNICFLCLHLYYSFPSHPKWDRKEKPVFRQESKLELQLCLQLAKHYERGKRTLVLLKTAKQQQKTIQPLPFASLFQSLFQMGKSLQNDCSQTITSLTRFILFSENRRKYMEKLNMKCNMVWFSKAASSHSFWDLQVFCNYV